MRKSGLVLALSAVIVSTGFAEIVTSGMDDLSAWKDTEDWSVNGGIAESVTANRSMTMTTGVAAPVNEGDFVIASVVQRITFGSAGLASANQKITQLAITGSADDAFDSAAVMWTRRDQDDGDFWGATLSIEGATPGYAFGGWNNISAIGFSDSTDAVSDWFTAEVKITKTASAYDMVIAYYDNTGTEVWSDDVLNTDLGTLAAADTWYLNMGTEYQMETSGDVTKMEVDSATLATEAIPEPATVGMLGIGVLLLVMNRRRRCRV